MQEYHKRQKIMNRLGEVGLQIADILIQAKCDQDKRADVQTIDNLTQKQILDILSLQSNSTLQDGNIILKYKKKRWGKLNIEKFLKKFASKK